MKNQHSLKRKSEKSKKSIKGIEMNDSPNEKP